MTMPSKTMLNKSRATAAALGLLALATPATAAPVGALTGVAEAVKHDASVATAAEQVTYRCWRYRGHVRCGNVRPQIYSYYYAPRPYVYGYASRPSFSFSWGGYRRWY